MRRGSALLLGYFCKNTKLNVRDELPQLISTLIILLTDVDQKTVQASWDSLNQVTSTIPKEEMSSYLKVVRDAVGTARDRERRKRKGHPLLVPGLTLPKALQPILPIYLQGLMSGSAETREQAAEGLGELIVLTSEAALRPFVIPITGPLIRIIGDRFPWQVKKAILGTLSILISKGGIGLKPFLPQLQTSFLKCLNDNSRSVRTPAARALGKLSALNPRVDPLVNDLLNNIQNSEAAGKEAMLLAVKGVIAHAGKNMTEGVLVKTVAALKQMISNEDEDARVMAARTLGIASQHLGDGEFTFLLEALAAPSEGDSWQLRHGAALAMASLLCHAPQRVSSSPSLLSMAIAALKTRSSDDKVPVREAAAKGTGRLLFHLMTTSGGGGGAGAPEEQLLALLASLMVDTSSDVRRKSLGSLKHVAKTSAAELVPLWPAVAPAVSSCLKDASQPVRMAAERTCFRLFQLNKGPDHLQAAQKYITGLEARRMAKFPEASEESDDSEGNGGGD